MVLDIEDLCENCGNDQVYEDNLCQNCFNEKANENRQAMREAYD